MPTLKAYEDPNDYRNGPNYRTGKLCITKGCNSPAGTYWGPYWCFKCNVARLKGISKQFESLSSSLDIKGSE
jgi:hypothetical protein